MIRIIVTILALTFLAHHTATAESAASANNKGIDAYREGDYEKSVEQFTDAIVREPESEIIRFNRGTALSAAGNREEALSELTRSAAASKDNGFAAGAYFNAGNTFLRNSELDAAIDQYRKAIKLDQASPDIRHNLELALRLRDQQQQQQQKQQQDSDEENPNEQDSEQDDQEESEEQQESDDQQQQQGDQEQSESTPQDQQVATPMSIEEAERILDAIENEERQTLAQKNQQMKSGITHGNDW